MSSPLSPTRRSTPRRERERALADRAALYDVLAASLVCHLAVVVDGVPLALPTVFAVDGDGPDEGGTLYVHGSVASRSLVQAPDQDVSVTVTVLDGIVLARSGFDHSMNYRSAVVIGRGPGPMSATCRFPSTSPGRSTGCAEPFPVSARVTCDARVVRGCRGSRSYPEQGPERRYPSIP